MTDPVARDKPRRSPTCTCGHVFTSHRQDPIDPWITERCVTCGCAAFLNREEAKMQGEDDDG